MSIRIQSEVWTHSRQKGGALLVLLALSDNANDETHLAWPSVNNLARRSRMSRRQVQSILRKLEEDGEIRTVEQGGYIEGESKATLYRVFHPEDRSSEARGGAIIAPGGRSLQHGGGEVFDKGGRSGQHPNHKENHKKEPIRKSKEKESEEVKRRREGFEWWFGD